MVSNEERKDNLDEQTFVATFEENTNKLKVEGTYSAVLEHSQYSCVFICVYLTQMNINEL